MFMKKTSLAALTMTLGLGMIMTACGGKDEAKPAADGASAKPADKAVKVTFLNSKAEIQAQLQEAADAFTKANPNITIELMLASTGQSPFEKASVLYSSGTPATMAMLDTGDILKFKDKAVDLSGEKWVADLAQPNQIDGKTLSFPFAVEGYGLIYNKAVLDKATGGAFNPANINTTAALEELFKKLQDSGVAPITIGSMDWSLGNHFLALSYANQPDDVNKYLGTLKTGSVKIADNAAFKGLMDTFDVMKNYNSGKKDPMTVTYEQSAAAVAKGTSAITFNGNWMIGEIQKTNPTGEFGFIPVPVSGNAGDKANNGIAIGATKQVFIDKSVNTADQQAAAKKFLEWMVYDQAGQDFLVNKASVIPAFKNITLEPKDSLAKAIKSYNNAGKSLPFAGNYVPGDHWKELGASMQKYLVNKSDRAALANEIQEYWKKVK